MRVLILDSYYDRALTSFYEARPGLSRAPHDEQLAALMAFSFGTADYYSRGLRALGHDAAETVVNAGPLQQAWAREHGVRRPLLGTEGAWLRRVVLERVRRERPDALYIQDVTWPDAALLGELRACTRVIAGQTAYPLPHDCDLRGFDVIFSSLPHYVRLLRRRGLAAEPLRIGFDPVVLERLGPIGERHGAVFVGSLGGHHAAATRLLERVVQRVPLELWGPGVAELPLGSPLRAHHRGEAWGLDMYRVLARARVAINRHIDIAGVYANNMRLFEATGVGALLVTEAKENLSELFEPGKEVVTYRPGDADDLAERVVHFLNDAAEAAVIARAGQARTLRDHTYAARMQEVSEVLARHVRRARDQGPIDDLKRAALRARAAVDSARALVATSPIGPVLRPLVRTLRRAKPTLARAASTEHRHLAATDDAERLATGWTAPEIARKQRALVDAELELTYFGHPPRLFSVAAEAMRQAMVGAGSNPLVVEVGAASGYYEEVLSHLLGRRLRYVGVDFALAPLELGRSIAADLPLASADATRLPFHDECVDVLFSAGVILCVPDWRRAVGEAARVTRGACVFHRTPVMQRSSTATLSKLAYGVPVLEHVFSRAELEACIAGSGLEVTEELLIERGEFEAVGHFETVTLVCRRRARVD